MRGHRSAFVVFLVANASLVSANAAAQPVDLPSERVESSAAPPALEEPTPPGEPPRAQTGFQVAFRSGAALPAGSISEGDSLSDVFGWQVPLLVELGGKPTPWLFVGAYAGAGFGGVAPEFERGCNGVGVSCSSRSLRVGIEGIVYLLPSGWVDPWLGYGIGYESSTVVGESRGAFATQSVSGLELAHFMAGLDVRISHTVGLGPYLDVAMGRYGSLHRDPTATADAVDVDIDKPAFHQWVTLGARAVIFP